LLFIIVIFFYNIPTTKLLLPKKNYNKKMAGNPEKYEFIEFLKNRLKKKLPGKEAHLQMAPLIGNEPYRNFTPSMYAEPSSVMVLLIPDELENEFSVLLTLRSSNLNSHKGQISFPGGRAEYNENPIEAALRETWEEIGIEAKDIRIVGKLSELYVPPSNAIITPVVGFINSLPPLKINSDEVETAFLFGLSSLKSSIKRAIWNFKGKDVDVPFWDVGQKTPLWGATAMILTELLIFIQEFNDNSLPN
jgi:8-oxo-dGTP pyrophosphatase MutT (NUDIX family)